MKKKNKKNNKDKNKNGKFELTESQERYICIYHQYFVLRWTWNQICMHHECSTATVGKAINWVIENRLNVPSTSLIKGAIDAIRERLQKNKELYDREAKKQKRQDKSFIVALNKEIREDEKVLYELEEVYRGDKDDDGSGLTAAQVINLVKAAEKEDE